MLALPRPMYSPVSIPQLDWFHGARREQAHLRHARLPRAALKCQAVAMGQLLRPTCGRVYKPLLGLLWPVQAKLSSRSKSSKQVLDASTVGVQPDKGAAPALHPSPPARARGPSAGLAWQRHPVGTLRARDCIQRRQQAAEGQLSACAWRWRRCVLGEAAVSCAEADAAAHEPPPPPSRPSVRRRTRVRADGAAELAAIPLHERQRAAHHPLQGRLHDRHGWPARRQLGAGERARTGACCLACAPRGLLQCSASAAGAHAVSRAQRTRRYHSRSVRGRLPRRPPPSPVSPSLLRSRSTVARRWAGSLPRTPRRTSWARARS